jgi:hypothetical protein
MSSRNRMTEAQQIAQTVGIVVGAASCCEQVTEERVNAVAIKLRELVAAAADDDSDADLANEQFSAALEKRASGREREDRARTGRGCPKRAGTATLGLKPRVRRRIQLPPHSPALRTRSYHADARVQHHPEVVRLKVKHKAQLTDVGQHTCDWVRAWSCSAIGRRRAATAAQIVDEKSDYGPVP